MILDIDLEREFTSDIEMSEPVKAMYAAEELVESLGNVKKAIDYQSKQCKFDVESDAPFQMRQRILNHLKWLDECKKKEREEDYAIHVETLCNSRLVNNLL